MPEIGNVTFRVDAVITDEQYQEAMGAVRAANERMDLLEDENVKLRELVRIAIEYCVNGYCAEEDECPLYESRHSCRLHTEARDLGVEVDG